jgi:hypothetical protein
VGVVVAIAALGALVLGVIGGLWGRTPAGNTALVVPFGGGPALVAGGWAALALAFHHDETRPAQLWRAALLAGGAALVVSLISIYLPIVLSSGDLQPGALVLAALFGVLVARVLGHQPDRNGWLAFGAIALASVVLVALAPGFAAILDVLLVPLLVALPVALSTPKAHALALLGASLAVLIVVVGGVLLGGYVVARL